MSEKCEIEIKPYEGTYKIIVPKKEMIFGLMDLWVMKITENGIIFNREAFPNHKPNDFALDVIEILEKGFNVKFEKKELL